MECLEPFFLNSVVYMYSIVKVNKQVKGKTCLFDKVNKQVEGKTRHPRAKKKLRNKETAKKL